LIFEFISSLSKFYPREKKFHDEFSKQNRAVQYQEHVNWCY